MAYYVRSKVFRFAYMQILPYLVVLLKHRNLPILQVRLKSRKYSMGEKVGELENTKWHMEIRNNETRGI